MAKKTTCDLCDKEIIGHVYHYFSENVELRDSILEFSLEAGSDGDSPDICSGCYKVIANKVQAGIKEGLKKIKKNNKRA